MGQLNVEGYPYFGWGRQKEWRSDEIQMRVTIWIQFGELQVWTFTVDNQTGQDFVTIHCLTFREENSVNQKLNRGHRPNYASINFTTESLHMAFHDNHVFDWRYGRFPWSTGSIPDWCFITYLGVNWEYKGVSTRYHNIRPWKLRAKVYLHWFAPIAITVWRWTSGGV